MEDSIFIRTFCKSISNLSNRIKPILVILLGTILFMYCFQKVDEYHKKRTSTNNRYSNGKEYISMSAQESNNIGSKLPKSSSKGNEYFQTRRENENVRNDEGEDNDDDDDENDEHNLARHPESRKFQKTKQKEDDEDDDIKGRGDNAESKSETSNKDKRLEKRLPKCLVIGFAKCGSYALKAFLQLHPDIECAPNEVNFFNENYEKGLDWYREQMPLSLPHQITVEKTPLYITNTEAMPRIRHFNSSIKLVVAVRDPVTRIPSTYEHSKIHNPNITPSFDNFVQTSVLQKSGRVINYVPFIQRAYDLFPRKQVLVVSEEDLERRPVYVMREIEKHLGLRHAITESVLVFNEEKGFYCFNVSHPLYKAMPEKPKVIPETGCFYAGKGRAHEAYREDLYEKVVHHVQPFNDELFKLIGKRFKWTTPDDL